MEILETKTTDTANFACMGNGAMDLGVNGNGKWFSWCLCEPVGIGKLWMGHRFNAKCRKFIQMDVEISNGEIYNSKYGNVWSFNHVT